jgi:hypothetical protein
VTIEDVRSAFEGAFDQPGPEPEPRKARMNGAADPMNGAAPVRLDDFVAYMPSHSYIFVPSRETWAGASVNARIRPVKTKDGKEITAAAWLDRHRPVEQMTWAPGEPLMIRDRLIAEGGWFARPGCTVFNLYRPPAIAPAAGDVRPWLDHIRLIYGDDSAHIVLWLAHRVRRPHEKINHALVLGGKQGIGKDTILEPVKRAVGPWNFSEVSPQQVLGRFNGFLKSVVLRVSEAKDLGDVDRFAFYDHMKTYTAAPPDVLRVDEKNRPEYAIPNVCGAIITTNHKTDGIYLPADDRRHFVAWSDAGKEDFDERYWCDFWAWLDNGGAEAVAHHLHNLDLTHFNPKAPPPKTSAFWEIVNASRAPENDELADILDRLADSQPIDAITLDHVKARATEDFLSWLRDGRNARKIPHRLEDCGFVQVCNPDAKDGRWRIRERRQTVYARQDLPERERYLAARRLAESGR